MSHAISAILTALITRHRAVLAADTRLASQHGWITEHGPAGARIYYDHRFPAARRRTP